MSAVEVKVRSQKGKCVFGHEVGDVIAFDGRTIEGPICFSALSVLMPRAHVGHCACPDPENPVVFEIQRLRRK